MVDDIYSSCKDYIFSSDSMAAVGISQLIKHGQREVIIKITSEDDLSQSIEHVDDVQCERLIVYLPRDPISLFISLKKTAVYLKQSQAPSEVIIITPYSFNWLYHTLRPLVSPDLLRKIRAIDASLCLEDILRQLKDSTAGEYCLPIQARREEIATGQSMNGLTRREYDCVLDFFCGRSIQEPLYSQKSSAISTRYSQRNAGLRKLIEQLPSAAPIIRKKRIELNR